MRKIILFCLLVVSLFSYQQEELSPTLQKAFTAVQNEDYQTALKIFNQEAAKGNPIAYETLGELYMFGIGVKQDFHKAAEFFHKAIESDNKTAKISSLVILGNIVFRNTKHYDEAYSYLKQAADMGSVSAMRHIGEMYESGELGEKKNIEKAIFWYKKAANLNDPHSFVSLGLIYYYDKKDNKKALKYFQTAYNLGERDLAAASLGNMYYNGEGVQQDYKKAAHYLEEAAQKGNDMASNLLAILYVQGKGVKMDKMKAYNLWLEAAKRGDEVSQKNLDILCKESPWVCK
jgi:TPR repeat protein